jgi:hypothetical protein
MRTPFTRSARLMSCLMGLLTVLTSVVSAASAQSARFDIAGGASIVADATVQNDARYALKAQLVVAESTSAAVTTQSDARFALNAVLSTSSLVCYNDTIFRDGFDGTGL